jgi:NAD(P)H-dependent flavin oxidoreductase YrpB (nitropropane dioxygenase family)
MSFTLDSVILSGKETLPIIEGGKGIGVSAGVSSGAFAAVGAVGTFSGANAMTYNSHGEAELPVYNGKTRQERHEELVQMGIDGGVTQARIAHEISKGKGPIHINILWEMGGAQRVLEGILERARGLVHGVTCGAGMPYGVAEIAAKYKVYYYPIVSSVRAFRALWKRAYHKFASFLGGVVYEDPWKAGGHNGLSNQEDPLVPQDPYPRVVEIRKFMSEVELDDVPIIMAGGVWHLKEWEHWLRNKEIGKIAFQFGTRPIVTKESPVPEGWKHKLLGLKPNDVALNRFSPTGFYSSAVRNKFIEELEQRSERQVKILPMGDGAKEISYGRRSVYISESDFEKVQGWRAQGFDTLMKTPEETLIFVTQAQFEQIRKDQIACMGCLSACRFSNWRDRSESGYTTGVLPDPRSYCIQKTLQNVVRFGDVDHELMFSGHNAFRFATDPFYKDGFIPSVKQLVERMVTGY